MELVAAGVGPDAELPVLEVHRHAAGAVVIYIEAVYGIFGEYGLACLVLVAADQAHVAAVGLAS